MRCMTALTSAACVLLATCASLTASAPTVDPVPHITAAPTSNTTVSYIGNFDLGAATDDQSVGGLSGLTALADGSYLAISDDKGDYGPTRAYRLTIDNNGEAQVTGEMDFTNPDGSAYNPAAFDAEEIRQLPNAHLLWTTEGDSSSLLNRSPMIIESDADGREVRRIQPPAYHVPNLIGTRGINANKGPEAMSVSPDGATIYTINENTLIQDGQLNTETSGAKTRMTAYDAATGQPTAEYVVDVDPVYAPGADRGYASLATAPNGDLYALERGYIPDEGNRGEIYRLDTSAATNVLGKQQLDGTEQSVSREKVFDFADASGAATESPENVEGMTFAPAAPAAPEAAGSEVEPATAAQTASASNERLYLVSDNNFSDTQRTVIHTLDVATQ